MVDVEYTPMTEQQAHDEELQLDVTVGEYRVTFSPNQGLVGYRHDQRWRNLTGDNLIMSLAQRIRDLEVEVQELRENFGRMQYDAEGLRIGAEQERQLIQEYVEYSRALADQGTRSRRQKTAAYNDVLNYILQRGKVAKYDSPYDRIRDERDRYFKGIMTAIRRWEDRMKTGTFNMIQPLYDAVGRQNPEAIPKSQPQHVNDAGYPTAQPSLQQAGQPVQLSFTLLPPTPGNDSSGS